MARKTFCMVVCFWIGCPVLWANSWFRLEPTRFRLGDDPSWTAPDLNDRDWAVEHPGSGSRFGPGWSRTRFHLDATFENQNALLIQIHTLASYEIYWDGVPLGRNGQPGADRAREVPGRHLKLVVIPRHLTHAGEHVLALRMSSWRTVVPSDYFRIEAGPLSQITTHRTLILSIYTAVFALVLVAGLSFLAFGNRREHMIKRFGWLCIAVALLLALEQGKHLVHYPYPWHFYRLISITTLTIIVAGLLPWFLLARFRMAGYRYLLAAVVPPVLAPFLLYEPDQHCYWIFIYALAYSLFLCLHAARRGQTGWAPFAAVIGFSLILIPLTGDRFADRWFFPSFLLIVALLAARIIWETRGWREALVAEQLTSARLQVELLRKSIQPHFLKNTLAAAMSWFEENPTKGSRLLGSLADELDGFFRIGDQDRVPLQEELALCRHHVETMSYLLDKPLTLHYEGPAEEIILAPGLLITCVENALTHGHFDEDHFEIGMTVNLDRQALRIQIVNPAVRNDNPREGTGTRYLRAMLARHYPERWSLHQQYTTPNWVATLTIDRFSNERAR